MSRKSRQLCLNFAPLLAIALLGLVAASCVQPASGILSPAAGATVRGTINVQGYADDPAFSKWQLDLLPGGDAGAAVFLALGTAPRAFTYALDTTRWPDGEHALRERVVRTDGNYDEYFAKFVIANQAARTQGAAGLATAPATPVTQTAAVATPAPAADGILAPPVGTFVRGPVEVVGRATGPNFAKWQLDLVPLTDPNGAAFLTWGGTPGTFTYTLNTAAYPNGNYWLRLRNVQADGNYAEYTSDIAVHNLLVSAGAAAPPTEVVQYQPVPDPSLAPTQATCAASTRLPDRGAYRCATATGLIYDPCMVAQGQTLVCPLASPQPHEVPYPVVTATNTLPAVPKQGWPASFELTIKQDWDPTCDLTDPGKTIGGKAIMYVCNVPGAFLVSQPEAAGATWVVQYMDDRYGNGAVSGPLPNDVIRALVY